MVEFSGNRRRLFRFQLDISKERMEMEQQLEWNEAQKAVINVDLVPAAKEQPGFLAAVDRNRWLYEGPGLDKAIHRVRSIRLKTGSILLDTRLTVRNYMGRILDNHDVASLNAKSKQVSEELWKQLYANEPYELDSARALSEDVHAKPIQAEKCSDYDLVSAVKRQSPFFYQVSRPHINNDLYLEGAVARYKGFLHLIRRNKERSIKSFTVPTYDIDLYSNRTKGKSWILAFLELQSSGETYGQDIGGQSSGDIRNLPEGHKGSLVSFSKTQPDRIFNAKRKLTILSVAGEKQPLEIWFAPTSKLTMEKWLEVVLSSKNGNSEANLFTSSYLNYNTYCSNSYVFHFVRPRAFSKASCFFPLPGRIQYAKNWTRVIDDAGDEIISLQMRDSKKSKGKNDSTLQKEVIGISKSREQPMTVTFELAGHRNVKFFSGQRLDYEHKHCTKQRSQDDFMTAVEFSAQDPYGKALALVDLKFGVINVKEEWFLLPGSITAVTL
ncbi:hypothetical protein HAX54_016208 [Datura stramonium]|uniref:Uncharacterized protein n=1 Tax=Datura stramonium TaxID=4076 RepID=A0ABS8UIJ8_DATST|nr:hypothetical protein [Datura stramonium]